MDILVIYVLMLAIPIIASINIKVTYAKYKEVANEKKMTGYDVARLILDQNGLNDMYIVESKGFLSDCYDPTRKTVRLSTDIYHGTSIAAMSVAAHECGHAIQDKEGYSWMKIRSTIFPMVNIGTSIAYVILLIGLFLQAINLIQLAIVLTGLGLIFELVTLPVEFDASKRALEMLNSYNISVDGENDDAKKMLSSAAYTYVASVLSSALEMLYLILEFTDRR